MIRLNGIEAVSCGVAPSVSDIITAGGLRFQIREDIALLDD